MPEPTVKSKPPRKSRARNRTIPRPSLERLTEYLVILDQLRAGAKRSISSTELAELYGNTPSQVRQDIFQLTGARRCGQGYSILQLSNAIRSTLKLDNVQKVAIIGCGRMGQGLACNLPFDNYGLELAALFDIRDEMIGHPVTADLCVTHHDQMKHVIQEKGITIAMITVPDAVAQSVADELVEAGICCILNYAHERLKVPPHVVVKYQQVVCSLMQLSYFAHTVHKTQSRKKTGENAGK